MGLLEPFDFVIRWRDVDGLSLRHVPDQTAVGVGGEAHTLPITPFMRTSRGSSWLICPAPPEIHSCDADEAGKNQNRIAVGTELLSARAGCTAE